MPDDARRVLDRTPQAGVTRRVLLVAFHFPPEGGSTGRLRTLAFVRHLPAFGWQPIVLAPKPAIYERQDPASAADIPHDTVVHRTRAFDSRRHLGWRGRYFSATALPDRWIGWWPGAVVAGLRLIRHHRIDAIWSTYPIATTHLVACALARRTGLPWIADFRDPVVPSGTRAQRWAARRTERLTLRHARYAVFTTPGACKGYSRRYPELADAGRLAVVENGYENGGGAPSAPPPAAAPEPDRGAVTLVHSGLLYREGRNPAAFFEALALWRQREPHLDLRVVLRASGHEAEYRTAIERLGLEDIVTLAPAIGHREALAEQARSDGLLLFQGREFNAQVPAKVFEYLQIGRPILALTDAAGDTARLLADTGGATCVAMDDAPAIARSLSRFVSAIVGHSHPGADRGRLARYTRRACTERLASLLDETCAQQEVACR